MDRFKAEKGKVDAVTTRVERFSQSRPLGKPGEGLDCVYRMRGAGLKAINQYRYTQLALHARADSVELLLGGARTPWCGALGGRADPRRCCVRVEAGGAGGASDTLELTLGKAEKQSIA